MFLHNGYQTAAEKCCVPEHKENLNDWYARKHVHGCKLRELTVHAYFGCFYECLPLVYERCFCVGQVIYALVRAWKINSTTTAVHISWAYFWWMFSLHTLAEEAKIPLLFFSHQGFTECRGYCRSSPIVRDAVRLSPLVVKSLSESGEARGLGSSSCWSAIDASHRYRSNSSTTKLQLATVPAARSKPDAPSLVPGP